MSYTNATSSNWNPELYSKQVGGGCVKTCKKNCKKNCATYCQLAKSDGFNDTVHALKAKRDALRLKLKEMESKEKVYDQFRIRELIRNSYYQDERDYLRKLKRGGTRKRRGQRRSRRGGEWFSNPTSLAPCEKACTEKCDYKCGEVCSEASYSVHDGTELTSLKNEIKLLELTVDRIESKLNP